MLKFFFGIVIGIVVSTVGIGGVAELGNKAITNIQSFASSSIK